VNAWLDRLDTLFRPNEPNAEISEISENPPTANNGDNGDFSTGINAPKEPLDLAAQLRVIEEDLAAEGTSLGKEQAKFARRRGRSRKSDEAIRAERWCRAYLADITPTSDTPKTLCLCCGDVVFWRRSRRTLWACRSCRPPRAGVEVQWAVLPSPPLTGLVEARTVRCWADAK
jgi:hypothetical protein